MREPRHPAFRFLCPMWKHAAMIQTVKASKKDSSGNFRCQATKVLLWSGGYSAFGLAVVQLVSNWYGVTGGQA